MGEAIQKELVTIAYDPYSLSTSVFNAAEQKVGNVFKY